ncbi:MAG: hypothetical protein LBJ43_03760, partial [Propionibacteriaceae bacterium]|nr:hypothetical protein [Propionibacteriaceae bacterium]
MFIKNRVRSGLVVGSVERVCCSAGVAAVLAGVLLIVVAIVGARVGARVGAVLDENWRGTYDILVMPRGQDFNASETEGLVEPNFVATSGMGGITEAVLAEVRAISGVEVAAPIGMVGSLRRYALGPILYLADDLLAGVSASFDGALTAQLRVTSVLFDAAGDSSEVLSSGEGRVWLPARPASDIPSGFDSEPLSAVGVPEGFSPIVFGFVTGSVYAVPLGMLPAFASVVLAVDPVAEMQLLGRENAEFLDRLVRVPFERKTEDGEIEVEWVSVPAERTADMTWSKLVKEDVFALPQIDIYGAADEANRTGVTSQVVPLVVNSEPTRKLVLRLEVALAEGVAADTQLSSEALRALPDESFTPFATLEVDISDSLVPFSDPGLTLPFPGTILPPGKGGGSAYIEAASLEPMLVGRPSYVETATHGDSPAFEVMPKDVVGSDGLPVGDTYHNNSGMDSGVGLVRAYRSMTGVGGVSGVLPAPLGTFMSADLNDPSSGDASYVALGFSDTTSTWRNSSSGEQEEVLANLSGVDFITMAPGAFTDLLGGAALRGATPIDAIRVRVAGITGYTPEAQQRIIDV